MGNYIDASNLPSPVGHGLGRACDNDPQIIRSVFQRLEEVQARAAGVRNSARKILATCLQRSTCDEKESPGRSGLEGRLNDIADVLNETESILQELGAYLFG